MYPAHRVHHTNSNAFADAFSSSLPLPAILDPEFAAAIRHVLDNPGSLVRPRLVFQMATAYGMDAAPAQNLAIALEYFHTASLLFDDLPCMDSAMERRGAPCTHIQFGEDGAILVALALINRAYALLWGTVSPFPQDRQRKALAYVESCLGVNGLLNGQSLDLHFSRLPQTRETIERIATGKTVSLIRLTLALPAMLGGASSRELQQLERISTFWGLSYQILDDLKDLRLSAEQSGKTSARDVILGRPNIAEAIGICGALQRLTRFLDLADAVLRKLLVSRPELIFLEKLRGEFQQDLALVRRDALALAEKG